MNKTIFAVLTVILFTFPTQAKPPQDTTRESCLADFKAWANLNDARERVKTIATEDLLQNANEMNRCVFLFNTSIDQMKYVVLKELFEHEVLKRYVDFIKRHSLGDDFKQEEDPH